MTNIIEIDAKIYNALVESFGEEMLKEKIGDILLSAIENRIAYYTYEMLKFEEKYGASFKEFEKMWDEDKIEGKYSYEVEGDFIDWEMMEMEKRELLSIVSKLKGFKKK